MPVNRWCIDVEPGGHSSCGPSAALVATTTATATRPPTATTTATATRPPTATTTATAARPPTATATTTATRPPTASIRPTTTTTATTTAPTTARFPIGTATVDFFDGSGLGSQDRLLSFWWVRLCTMWLVACVVVFGILWWFVVFCGGLWWFVVVCSGLW